MKILNTPTKKTRHLPVACLLAALSLVLCLTPLGVRADEEPETPCEENGPYYGDWTLDYCPSMTNSPSVSPTTLCAEVGQAPTVPTVVPPAYQGGQKERTVTYDCPTTNAPVEYASIGYTVGSVQWDPELPGSVTNSFSSTAYVEVTSDDEDLCPSPGRVNIGTASWVVSCNYSYSTTNCTPGSVTMGTPTGTTNVCQGTGISASVSTSNSNAIQVITMIYTNACGNVDTNNCPPTYITNNIPPTIVSNWWSASVGSFSASGSGLSASFNPTNCGDGSITFNTKWKNGCDDSEQTATKTLAVKVTAVNLTPTSASAKINKCQDPNRTVTFSLTNTCGSVTWSIDPSGVSGGASISGGVVTIGDVVTNYTIKAVSNDNTNCYATASLSVTRDCVCTNHILGGTASQPGVGNGGSCGATDNWAGAVITTKCGNTAQLTCEAPNHSFVHLKINGSTIGHCPYTGSLWVGEYWKCQCGDVIMKGQFRVVNVATNTAGTHNGKTEVWTCADGQLARECWTTPTATNYGTKTSRTCDSGDEYNP